MKNIKNLKPKSFIFDHQLKKHVTAPTARIIEEFNETLPDRRGGSWPVWKTIDWYYFLEEYVEDYLITDDKVKAELEALHKYLVHEAEFDYIVIGD